LIAILGKGQMLSKNIPCRNDFLICLFEVLFNCVEHEKENINKLYSSMDTVTATNVIPET
jgi:hypothetical protein